MAREEILVKLNCECVCVCAKSDSLEIPNWYDTLPQACSFIVTFLNWGLLRFQMMLSCSTSLTSTSSRSIFCSERSARIAPLDPSANQLVALRVVRKIFSKVSENPFGPEDYSAVVSSSRINWFRFLMFYVHIFAIYCDIEPFWQRVLVCDFVLTCH